MERREKLIKTVEELRPIDDTMFTKLAEDKGFCREVIQTILGKEIEVVSVMPQKELRNIEGRSVTVDVLCKDKNNQYFNVEVQKEDNDDHQKRVRLMRTLNEYKPKAQYEFSESLYRNVSCDNNGSNVDTYITEKGTKFKDLPDVYVIYISKFDVFNLGKTCYHVDRTIRGTDMVVDNGFHEIYVNTKVKDDSDISELMDIFMSAEVPKNNKFPEVTRTISNIKTAKGRDYMCDAVMDFAKEYAKEEVLNNARELIKNNVSVDIITKSLNLTTDEVQTLYKEMYGEI